VLWRHSSSGANPELAFDVHLQRRSGSNHGHTGHAAIRGTTTGSLQSICLKEYMPKHCKWLSLLWPLLAIISEQVPRVNYDSRNKPGTHNLFA
jgi:hypothetical protein